jgi:hypothetical protein
MARPGHVSILKLCKKTPDEAVVSACSPVLPGAARNQGCDTSAHH